MVTSDPALHQRIQRYRTHGVDDPRADEFPCFGFNFRFTDIQSAIMLEQLKRREQKVAAHISLYRRYADVLASLRSVSMIDVDIESGEVPLWIEVACAQRRELIDHLAEARIDARQSTPCLNRSPHFAAGGTFPHSRFFGEQALTLPSGPDQAREGIDRVLSELSVFDSTRPL